MKEAENDLSKIKTKRLKTIPSKLINNNICMKSEKLANIKEISQKKRKLKNDTYNKAIVKKNFNLNKGKVII
jgi:hypothetical protein